MIFTKRDGKMVEIKRQDYVRESDYYTAIILSKGFSMSDIRLESDKRIINTVQKHTRKGNHKIK